MRLEMTRRTDYALRAMLALAREPDVTLSSGDIASRTGIPVRFVVQVMGHLVRAGLAHGVIGRSGGYRLASRPESVSVLAIVEAVEGDARRPQCVLRGGPCAGAAPCAIHHVFADARSAFTTRLAATTLASVAAAPGEGTTG
jgi:Rrf2 family protein